MSPSSTRDPVIWELLRGRVRLRRTPL